MARLARPFPYSRRHSLGNWSRLPHNHLLHGFLDVDADYHCHPILVTTAIPVGELLDNSCGFPSHFRDEKPRHPLLDFGILTITANLLKLNLEILQALWDSSP